MKKLRTEEQIIASWKGDFDKPVVSICCATYNHESYIKKTLEGFLIQETDFSFEILIYDDASTDNNANIIREYEAKYPRLIKPIYQTINKYSQGIKTNPVFNWFRAKGEYSALCEGDDYWFSAEKLQVQIELMKRYSDINLSFHPSYISDKDSKNKKKLFCNYGDEIKIFSPDIIINCAASQIVDDSLKSIEELIYSNLYSQSGFLNQAKKNKNFIGYVAFGSRWEFNKKGNYQPNSFYAATKHASVYLLQYFVDKKTAVVVLKIFDTYGEGDNRNKILNLL